MFYNLVYKVNQKQLYIIERFDCYERKHDESKKKRIRCLAGNRDYRNCFIPLISLCRTGWFLGVPLFFVLSGYLMFVTSQRNWENGNFHIAGYYKKRLRKIVPPLFTMVMVICCYLTLTQSSQLIGIRQEICSIFLGYDNWWQIQQQTSYFSKLACASPFTHLWFLAVEIQFYLLWRFCFCSIKNAVRLSSVTIYAFSFCCWPLLPQER